MHNDIPLYYWAGLLDNALRFQIKDQKKLRAQICASMPVLNLIQKNFGGIVFETKNSISLKLNTKNLYVIANILKDIPSLYQKVYKQILTIKQIKEEKINEIHDTKYQTSIRSELKTLKEYYVNASYDNIDISSEDLNYYRTGYIEAGNWIRSRLRKGKSIESILSSCYQNHHQLSDLLSLPSKGQLFSKNLINYIDSILPYCQINTTLYNLIKQIELTKTRENSKDLYIKYLGFIDQINKSINLTYSVPREVYDKKVVRYRLNKEQEKTDKKQKEKEARQERKKTAALIRAEKKAERKIISEEKKRMKLIERKNRQENKIKQKLEKKEIAANLLKNGQKFCPKCEVILPIGSFSKNCKLEDGYGMYCKQCSKEAYYLPFIEENKEKSRMWHKNNPEKSRALVLKHRKTRNQNPYNRLKHNINKQLQKYLKDLSHMIFQRDLIGCSPKELNDHLSSQLKPEWTWENYGKVWHIDHIIPCAAFDFRKPDQLKWCWNYKNLRPLDAKENLSKSDMLPNGDYTTNLKRNNPQKLIEILAIELDKMKIATAEQVKSSYADLNTIKYIKI